MQAVTVTTTTSNNQGSVDAQRQSSFLAGHTASGPMQSHRMMSDASSSAMQAMNQQSMNQQAMNQQAMSQQGMSQQGMSQQGMSQRNMNNVHTLASTASQRHVSTYSTPAPTFANGMATGMSLLSGRPGEEMYYQGMQIIGEQVIEHEMSIPTRKLVEEIVEKVVVVPEKIQREELCEERRIVRERIVQVAQPVEKMVYVDDIQVVERDKIVEVPQYVQKENLVYKDVWETQEVVQEVPKYVDREHVVEYEVPEYIDIPVPRTIECEETRVIEKIVEKPVPRYVEIEVPDYREVEVVEEVHRAVPVAYEHVVEPLYKLPALEAEYEEIPLPVFVPTFTEVPVPAEYLTDQAILESQQMRERIAMVATGAMPSLCVIEDLGLQARRMQPANVSDTEIINQRLAKKMAVNL